MTGVRIDRAAGTVTKTFPEGPDGVRWATVEHDRLARLHAVVDGIDGAGCPQPLGLVLEPAPAFTMTLVEGRPMVDHLADRSTDRRAVDRIAALLVATVRAYAGATGEAIPDLHFRNMLHGDGADELVLLDLGDPPGGWSCPLGPVEASIARLAGSTLFECTRPRHALRLRANVATARAARAAIEAAADGDAAVRSAIRSAAAAAARAIAGGRGPARRLWYATAGAALTLVYRRVVLARGGAGEATPGR